MAAVQEARSLQGSLLPTEIIIEIMKYLPDFSCLWSLINVSAPFKLVFMAFSREIVEEIMEKSTPTCIQALMRIVIHIQTSPNVFTGISDVVTYMLRKNPRISPNDFTRERASELSLQTSSPQVLLDFVGQVHTIHMVAHACLDFYIEKLMSLNPQRMTITDYHSYSRLHNAVYNERQSGEKFQPKELGLPRIWRNRQSSECFGGCNCPSTQGRLIKPAGWPTGQKKISSI